MASKIYSALVGEMIRVHIADTTDLVQVARDIHNTTPLATEAFSRVLTASSIMGKMLKSESDLLTFKIAGSNQIKTILVTANYNGDVKGYISHPNVDAPLVKGRHDVGHAIGKNGNLTLIRDYGLKEPYVGISNLKSGNIDEDLSFYFESSEQLPTEIALNTIMDGNKILAAGGIMIQIIPGIKPEEQAKIVEVSKNIFNIVELIKKGLKAEEIIRSYFGDMKIEMLGEYEVSFKCDCSVERISKALVTVGKEGLIELLEKDHGAELTCHFCNKKYKFDENELENIIKSLDE